MTVLTRGAGARHPPHQVREVIRLRGIGKSYREIRLATGISKTVAANICREAGVRKGTVEVGYSSGKDYRWSGGPEPGEEGRRDPKPARECGCGEDAFPTDPDGDCLHCGRRVVA